MFIDRARIYVEAGAGGDGMSSFRREKFVEKGGPNGGNGGRGGSVILRADKNLNTLIDFRYKRKFVAKRGGQGGNSNCTGHRADDVIVKVPMGTLVRDDATGVRLADLIEDGQEYVVAKGGRGGKGNACYATSTNRAPTFAEKGEPGENRWVKLELKLLADVGLVGFPNVGKSTLLSRVTNAQPKIANYHFTTLQPNLGVVDMDEGFGFVIADIPGLIEGASEGIGLGHEFLRHIERTKVMIHMVDAAGTEGRDPVADIKAINKELEAYNPQLLKKPQVIAANKIDAIAGDENEVISALRAEFEPQGIKVFPISAVSGKGLKELLYEVKNLLANCPKEVTVYEPEIDPALSFFKDEPYAVEVAADGAYEISGPKIEKMLGYTNMDSEKGFAFFQRFLREQGIIKELENMGIEDGDTVRMYDFEFDYYK